MWLRKIIAEYLAGMLAEKMKMWRHKNDCRLRRVSFQLVHNSRKVNVLLIRKIYRGADKSLARPGRKQARKHVGDVLDFNSIETQATIRCLFVQGKAPKEIDAILTEILASFVPGWAKDLSAPLCVLEDAIHLSYFPILF